jgi:hypothetical protein
MLRLWTAAPSTCEGALCMTTRSGDDRGAQQPPRILHDFLASKRRQPCQPVQIVGAVDQSPVLTQG